MSGGIRAGRVLAVLALLATIFVTLPANAQDDPDDQEVCILHSATGAKVKAILVSGAFATHAIATVTGHLVPHWRR